MISYIYYSRQHAYGKADQRFLNPFKKESYKTGQTTTQNTSTMR